MSDTQPTEQQLEDLKFAWRIVKHVKSNAITVAKDGRLLGMGSGQPNRVKSTEIALEKAADEAKVGFHEAVSTSEGLAACSLLHHKFSMVHVCVISHTLQLTCYQPMQIATRAQRLSITCDNVTCTYLTPRSGLLGGSGKVLGEVNK